MMKRYWERLRRLARGSNVSLERRSFFRTAAPAAAASLTASSRSAAGQVISLSAASINAPALDSLGNLSSQTSLATGSLVSRSFAARQADRVNIKDFGAIGDGSSHPLSSITAFGTNSTSGWTLAQWQAVFPFATALSNELDSCALIAAALQFKTVYAPRGTYLLNFGYTLTLAAGQAFGLTGDGASATAFAVSGAIVPLAIVCSAATGTGNLIGFEDFSCYQTQVITGGSFASVTSGTFYARNVSFGVPTGGSPTTTVGVFSPAIDFYTAPTPFIEACQFYGAVSYTLGGANGRNGMGVRNNGTSPSALSFGPNITSCIFEQLDTCVLIGDGTNAYVQGVKTANCTVAACNTFVRWKNTVVNTGASDYLSLVGNDLQTYGTGLDLDGVLTYHFTGNYFLGTSGTSMQIKATLNKPYTLNMYGNQFTGYGGVTTGLSLFGVTTQNSTLVSGNNFFDFDASGAVPIVLAASVDNAAICGNMFEDCNLPTDAGTNNIWSNNTVAATGGAANLFIRGIPTASPAEQSVSSRPIGAAKLGGDAGQFRLIGNTYSVILRNDDSNFFVLLTSSGTPGSSFNSLRPLQINTATGALSFDGTGAGSGFGGSVTISGQTSIAGGIVQASGTTTTITPTTGASVSIPSGCNTYVVRPSGSIASLRITTPPLGGAAGSCVDIEVIFLQAVSSIIWTAGSGTGIYGATLPSAAAVGTSVRLKLIPSFGGCFHATPA